LDLLLDHQLRQFQQKFLLSTLASVRCGVHAEVSFPSKGSQSPSTRRSLTQNRQHLLLTFFQPRNGKQKLNWSQPSTLPQGGIDRIGESGYLPALTLSQARLPANSRNPPILPPHVEPAPLCGFAGRPCASSDLRSRRHSCC